jgi:DNA invertase Pin-like site-specific DNA recombinase
MYYDFRTTILDILLEEVIMYLRKSRSDDPTLTVDEVLRNHEKELDEWCERNLGGKVPEANRYREIVSGEKLAERPEMQKLLNRLEDKKIKYIICVEPTRLSRGYLDEIGFIIKNFRYNKIKVITPTKIFNLEDEYDRELFERELKRGNEYLEYAKKVMYKGRLRKCADGEWIAGAPYGYKKLQYKEGKRIVKTLAIDEEKAEIVRMIYKWYAIDGMSIRGIENKLDDLKIVSPSGAIWRDAGSVTVMLQNPAYIGKVRYSYKKSTTEVINQEFVTKYKRDKDGCYLFDGLHTPIIDNELFELVQEKKKYSVPVSAQREIANMFSGIVYCKKCGHAVKLLSSRPTAKYLLCRHAKECSSSGVRYEEFLELICNTLEQSIDDFEIKLKDCGNNNEVEEHLKMIELTEKKLKKLERTEMAQWEAQTNPDVSQRMPQHIFKSLNDKVVAEIRETKEMLKELYSTKPEKVNYEPKIATFKKAIEYIKDDSISPRLKNEFLKGFIERIEFNREKVQRISVKEAKEKGIEIISPKSVYSSTPYTIEIFFKA